MARKSTFGKNSGPQVPPFATRVSRVAWTRRHLVAEAGASKSGGGGVQGCTISLQCIRGICQGPWWQKANRTEAEGYYKCSVLKSQWDILQARMLFRLELLLSWHATDYSLSIWLPMLRKTSKFSTRTPSWLAKLQTTKLPNMKQSSDLWHSEWVHKPPAQVELQLPWRVFTVRWSNFPKHCDTSGQMYCT